MRAALLAFALGVLLLRAFAALPSLPLLAALASVAIVLLGTRFFVLGACGLGLAWALLAAHGALADRLDPALEQRVLWIEGQVSGLPRWMPTRWASCSVARPVAATSNCPRTSA